MYKHKNNIVGDICKKWFDNANITLTPYEVGNSFGRTNFVVDDIYLRYIQFRTLHYRFFTNDILEKIGI